MPDRLVRAMRLLAGLLLVTALAGCWMDRYPRDPDDTLETVLSTRSMKVAAVDHAPWVVVDGDTPEGAEVELIEAFARELGVGIDWQRMPAFEALEGLEKGDLDLAIGGFVRRSISGTPGVAETYGYFREVLTVGSRPDVPFSGELDGRLVFVPADEPASGTVRSKGGLPTGDWRDGVALAVLPHWRLEPSGLVPTGIVLQRSDHVMVVPQGENAWLMRLERFLRRETGNMNERLRRPRP